MIWWQEHHRFSCYLSERNATEDIQDLKQISYFKRVVEPGIRESVIEIQNEQATWVEFEKALLAEYMLEDASQMTRHTLMTWIEKKGKNLCA